MKWCAPYRAYRPIAIIVACLCFLFVCLFVFCTFVNILNFLKQNTFEMTYIFIVDNKQRIKNKKEEKKGNVRKSLRRKESKKKEKKHL